MISPKNLEYLAQMSHLNTEKTLLQIRDFASSNQALNIELVSLQMKGGMSILGFVSMY